MKCRRCDGTGEVLHDCWCEHRCDRDRTDECPTCDGHGAYCDACDRGAPLTVQDGASLCDECADEGHWSVAEHAAGQEAAE